MNKRKHLDEDGGMVSKRGATEQRWTGDSYRLASTANELPDTPSETIASSVESEQHGPLSQSYTTDKRDVVIFRRSYAAQSPTPPPTSPYPIPISALRDIEEVEELLISGSFHASGGRRNDVVGAAGAIHTGAQLFRDRNLTTMTPVEQALQNMRNLIEDHIQVSDRDHPVLWKTAGRIVVDLSDAETHLRTGDVDEAMLSYDRVLARTTASAEKPGLALLQLISHSFSWSTYPQYTSLVTGLLSFLSELKGPHYNSILRLVAMSMSDGTQSPLAVKTILQRCMANYLHSQFGEDSPMVLWTKVRLSRYLVAAGNRDEAISLLDAIHTLHISSTDMDPFLYAELSRELGTTYWWLSRSADRSYNETNLDTCRIPSSSKVSRVMRKQAFRLSNLARTQFSSALSFYDTNKRAFPYRRAYVLNRLAYCQWLRGDKTIALANARESVTLFEASVEADKPQLRAAQDMVDFIEQSAGYMSDPPPYQRPESLSSCSSSVGTNGSASFASPVDPCPRCFRH